MTRMFAGFRLPYRRRAGIASVAFFCILVSTLAIANTLTPAHAFAANSAQVTVNAGQTLGTLSGISKGLNTAVWDGDLLDSSTSTAIKNAGVGMLRFPGGSTSDVYHWQSNSLVAGQGGVDASNTFDAFMSMAQSVGAQPLITVDYGAGTPAEAAGWVQYAKRRRGLQRSSTNLSWRK